MKTRQFLYIGILAVTILLASCKKDEVYAPKIPSSGMILFSVDDKALTGTIFLGVVQPSLDITAARFSKGATASPNYFGGNAIVTLNFSPELTKATINLVNTTTGVREKKAEFGSVSGSTVWTAGLSNLGFAGVTPAAGSTLVFEIIASNADGTITTTRVFQVQVIA